MSDAIVKLHAAQQHAADMRPAAGGFPVLAEVLRQAGVHRNEWSLPGAQSLYLTDAGPVMQQGQPLVTGTVDVPPFDQDSLIKALRTDQAGHSTFSEFLLATWNAGVVRYVADFDAREVTYYGSDGSNYVEAYPPVTVEPAAS